ncbi:MAG TPA: FAD-dependent oxidoreductase [Actinomycetes bacterium]|nr:FAD-dependent oxidoreductase [Actinomycetes bacterium]
MSELFARYFADARATMPLPYQPLAVADAVAALDHLSVQDRLDQGDFTAEERDLLNPVLATSCSAPCADGALTAMIRWFSLPGWDFGLMLDAVGIYPLRTADLVQALAADARPEVRLSTPVAAIEQRDERVTVTARGGEAFTAPMVVVAVPLNTLGTIDFRPALASETQAVADRGQASRGVKLWAHVRGDLEPFFFMAPDNHPLTFVVTEKVLDDGSQLLVGFGPDAQRLHPDDDREVRRAFRGAAAGRCGGRGGHRPRLVDRRVLPRDLVGLSSRSADRAPRPAGSARSSGVCRLGCGRRVERVHGRSHRVRPARRTFRHPAPANGTGINGRILVSCQSPSDACGRRSAG